MLRPTTNPEPVNLGLDIRTIPIDALFASDGINPNKSADFDPRATIMAADVILGVDVMSGHEFLLYGYDALQQIVRANRTEALKIVRIALDQATYELEQIGALITILRGHCDYDKVCA